MLAVIWKFIAQRKTKLPVRSRRRNRVGEIVRVSIALIPKIEPRLRKLMNKERIIAGNIFESIKSHLGTSPRFPRFARNRMRRRTQSQQVDHHQLAIMVPAIFQKTALRFPSHGKRFAAVQHPWPIGAFVDCSGKILNLGVLEILASGQHAAQQQGSVHGRKLAIPDACSRFHIDEVVIEPMFVGQMQLRKTQCLSYPLLNGSRFTVAARVTDAKSGESESGSRNAGNSSPVTTLHQRSILHKASRAGFVPEKIEGSAFDFIEQ